MRRYRRALSYGYFGSLSVGLFWVLVQRPAIESEWRSVLLASALLIAGTALMAHVWVVVVDAPPRYQEKLRLGFVRSQLAKYLPGGVWQGPVQIVEARATTSMGLAAIGRSYAHFLLLLLSGGLIVATMAIGLIAFFAVLFVAQLVTLPALRTRYPFIDPAPTGLARRAVHELRLAKRAITARVLGMSTAAVAIYSASFSLLLYNFEDAEPFLYGVGAFAAAWVGGLLVFVLPAGLGVREAVLVVLFSEHFDSTQVIATSISHRALQAVSEAVLVLGMVATQRVRIGGSKN